MGQRKTVLPEGHTWQSYTHFLLATLPNFMKMWYLDKFNVFEQWWDKVHSWKKEDWFDKNPLKGQQVYKKDRYEFKKVPAWERLAKCIIKNDVLCKSLSFAQTKGSWSKYNEYKEKYGY